MYVIVLQHVKEILQPDSFIIWFFGYEGSYQKNNALR